MNVQDRYQYRRSFEENIIKRPFLDIAQTDIANIDIHISFMDISSSGQALNFIVQVLDPYYKTYVVFEHEAPENLNRLPFLRECVTISITQFRSQGNLSE